jgi:hypothetical protein
MTAAYGWHNGNNGESSAENVSIISGECGNNENIESKSIWQ